MTIHFFKPLFLYDIMWAGAYPSYLQFLYPLNTCLWPVGESQRTQPEHHADTGRMHRLHTEKTLTSWGITVSTNGPTDYPVWSNKRQVQTSGKRSDLLLYLTQGSFWVKQPLCNIIELPWGDWSIVSSREFMETWKDVVLSKPRTSFPGSNCKGQMSSSSGVGFRQINYQTIQAQIL